MFTVSYLNARQMFFCELLYSLQSRENIMTFLNLLNVEDRQQCETLIELMKYAVSDLVESTDDADKVIAHIRGL